MSGVARKILRAALYDIVSQYALPTKTIVGSVLSRLSAVANKNLTRSAIEALNIAPDHNILEIGYGRGDGIGLAYQKIKDGDGTVFGIEASTYMEEVVFKRFILEISDTNAVRLDKASDLRNLPYPNNIMDGVFHIDSFYFWGPNLFEILQEIGRIMKPGGKIVCAMRTSRLRNLENWGIIKESQYNTSRYLLALEPAGFEEVKMEYVELSKKNSFELITAKKSPRMDCQNAEEILKKLEIMIKTELLARRVFELNRPIYDPKAFNSDEKDS